MFYKTEKCSPRNQPTTTNVESLIIKFQIWTYQRLVEPKPLGQTANQNCFVLKWNEKIAIDSIHPGKNGCNFYGVPASDLPVSGINKAPETKSNNFFF